MFLGDSLTKVLSCYGPKYPRHIIENVFVKGKKIQVLVVGITELVLYQHH